MAKREIILMKSTGLNAKGKTTGSSYTTTKNKRTMTEKFENMTYDREAVNKETGKKGMRVLYKEGKLPSSSK